MYAAHVSLAAGRPWSCMPKCQYGDIVDFIIFMFEIEFLPKYTVSTIMIILKSGALVYNVTGEYRWILPTF